MHLPHTTRDPRGTMAPSQELPFALYKFDGTDDDENSNDDDEFQSFLLWDEMDFAGNGNDTPTPNNDAIISCTSETPSTAGNGQYTQQQEQEAQRQQVQQIEMQPPQTQPQQDSTAGASTTPQQIATLTTVAKSSPSPLTQNKDFSTRGFLADLAQQIAASTSNTSVTGTIVSANANSASAPLSNNQAGMQRMVSDANGAPLVANYQQAMIQQMSAAAAASGWSPQQLVQQQLHFQMQQKWHQTQELKQQLSANEPQQDQGDVKLSASPAPASKAVAPAQQQQMPQINNSNKDNGTSNSYMAQQLCSLPQGAGIPPGFMFVNPQCHYPMNTSFAPTTNQQQQYSFGNFMAPMQQQQQVWSSPQQQFQQVSRGNAILMQQQVLSPQMQPQQQVQQQMGNMVYNAQQQLFQQHQSAVLAQRNMTTQQLLPQNQGQDVPQTVAAASWMGQSSMIPMGQQPQQQHVQQPQQQHVQQTEKGLGSHSNTLEQRKRNVALLSSISVAPSPADSVTTAMPPAAMMTTSKTNIVSCSDTDGEASTAIGTAKKTRRSPSSKSAISTPTLCARKDAQSKNLKPSANIPTKMQAPEAMMANFPSTYARPATLSTTVAASSEVIRTFNAQRDEGDYHSGDDMDLHDNENDNSTIGEEEMTGHERAAANRLRHRLRNREHARNTRLRKKAYLDKLKITLEELSCERDALVSERAGSASLLLEMQSTRTEVLLSFFALRSKFEKRRELWSSVLDESCFTCSIPVTPYRSFPASEVQTSKCQRFVLGVDGMMSDTASLHVLLNSLVDRKKHASHKVEVQFTLITDEAVVAGNLLMARWSMCTTNAVSLGARREVTKHGMLCAKFNSTHKLVALELMFDVMAFMLQLKQSAGSDAFSVVPNTVQTCKGPFHVPMVMTLAERPYTIVQVNRQWEEMTGWSATSVVGKASCQILQGPETDLKEVEDLMNCVRHKKPTYVALTNHAHGTGRRFCNHLNVYPLSTDSKITHYLGLTMHYEWLDTIDQSDDTLETNKPSLSHSCEAEK